MEIIDIDRVARLLFHAYSFILVANRNGNALHGKSQ